jgi:hypothetical protein
MHRHWVWKVGELKVTWQITRFAIDKYTQWFMRSLQEEEGELPWDVRKTLARTMWASLPPSEKCSWLYAAAQGKAAKEVAGGPALPIGLVTDDARARAILLTFHGDWGFDRDDVQRLVDQGLEGQALSDCLKKLPYCSEVCERLFKHMCSVGVACKLGRVSVAVEHCHHGTVAGRVHLHVYMSGVDRCYVGSFLARLSFESVPVSHMSLLTHSGGSTFHVKRTHEGHYYLQFEKIGSLARLTNFTKGEDFSVAKRWILNQFKVRKMSFAVAKEEILYSRDGVSSGVRELEFQENLLQSKELDLMSQTIVGLLKQKQLPFCELPADITAWKSQYDQEYFGVLRRFKPLVMDGPTRFGKTTWACSFFGDENTLVVDCQGVTSPCMKEYAKCPKKYKAILFDEGSWELVFRNKMLFQAGAKPVLCGQSPTNQYCFSVLVYQVPMIICSNGFFDGVSEDAKAYLQENIVYQQVNQACFIGN